MERLLNVNEVAEILNARVLQVYAWISEGIIPAVRLGRRIRISPEALQRFVEEGGKSYEGGWKKEA